MRYCVVPVADADGVARRLSAFAEDISDLAHQERALHNAEEQLRFVAEHTTDVVWQLDSHMRVIAINAADHGLRGCPAQAVIGQSFMDLFSPEGHGIIADVLARRHEADAHAGGGSTLRFEAPQVCQDGRTVWVEVVARPILGGRGQTLGFNGVTRAVDERKHYEAMLKDAQRRLQSQQAEIDQLHLDLAAQSLRDPLTGLHNRRYLDETLPRELSRARREGYPLALILVGVDRFGMLSEEYGTTGSNATLSALSLILNLGARDSDIFCRYGQHEFLVVLPMMGIEDAEQRAQAWCGAMSDNPVEHSGKSMAVTLSAGISAFPENGADVQTLLQRARQALYRSEQAGHNRVTRSSGHHAG